MNLQAIQQRKKNPHQKNMLLDYNLRKVTTLPMFIFNNTSHNQLLE